MFCSLGAGMFCPWSNLQEANLKTPFPIVNTAFTTHMAALTVCRVTDLSLSHHKCDLMLERGDLFRKLQVLFSSKILEWEVQSKVTTNDACYGTEGEKKKTLGKKEIFLERLLSNSLIGVWQEQRHVKWLREFIQWGQRENKNITRGLQLQPSNMTTVCFCAFDWGPALMVGSAARQTNSHRVSVTSVYGCKSGSASEDSQESLALLQK